MRSLVYAVFIVMLIIGTACGQTGPKTKWQTNFYVRFLEGQDQYLAEAKFKKAEAPADQKWESPESNVTFSGKTMKQLTTNKLGTFNWLQIKSPFRPNHAFEFMGKKVDITLPVAKNLSTDGPVRITEGFRLGWEGTKLDSTETLVIILKDGEGKVFDLSRLGPSSSASTKVFGAQLAGAKAGAGSLSVVRKKRIEIQNDPQLTGTILLEYYSEDIKIGLLE